VKNVASVVVTVYLAVTPLSDSVLTPFTSKVTRSAYAALTGQPPQLPMRRASFSVLFRDGKPLYRQLRPGDDPRMVRVAVRGGERLTCRFSLMLDEPPPLPQPSARFRVGAAELVAEVEQIEVVSASEVRLEVPEKFVVRFLTPTLLPVPGRGRLLKEAGVKRRYKLLPDLALALMLLVHDLRLQGVMEVSSSRVFKWAYRALAEIDYYVRPVTVLYTFRDGKPAVERGFTGYVAYELLDRSGLEVLSRLLGFAARFGLGKSRSVGFGHAQISPLK